MVAASEFKGHEGSVATNQLGGTTIGKVHGFTFNINNNIVPSFVIGSRTADNIKEGNLELSGSLTLALRDKTELLDLVVATPLADDILFVRLDDDVTGNETVDITIGAIKWNEWSTEINNDGATVLETATFMNKTLTVAEVTN